MKKTRIISKILYLLTRILTWIYLITTVYAVVSWVGKINIQIDENRKIIEYPLTDTPFLILDNTLNYFIFAFLLPMLSYTLFFYLLSNVFKVFFQEKLFTQLNILQLKRFYITNIILPIALLIFSSFFIEEEAGIFMIVALHIFLGIFIFIFSEIFNQGLSLQNEQDLFI
ncbi:MAG: hypothetical protein K8F60_14295 [Melioribacteraceae bacterium]|nr:hypothetical protein [Melioribacteraceae bacterium]